jgi:mRNA interferase HigB
LQSSQFAKYNGFRISEAERGRPLHVISRKKLLKAAKAHGELAGPLDIWYRIAQKAKWSSLEEVRLTLPATDAVGDYTVFNIKGNSYRLIAKIKYPGTLFVIDVLTHAEYDKGGWKK